MWLGKVENIIIIDKDKPFFDNDIEVDFLVIFQKGKIVFRSAWEHYYSHYTIELISRSGRLRYDYGGEKISWNNVEYSKNDLNQSFLSSKTEIIPNSMAIYQWQMVDQLANLNKNNNFPLCTGLDALDTLESINSIKEMIKDGLP